MPRAKREWCYTYLGGGVRSVVGVRVRLLPRLSHRCNLVQAGGTNRLNASERSPRLAARSLRVVTGRGATRGRQRGR